LGGIMDGMDDGWGGTMDGMDDGLGGIMDGMDGMDEADDTGATRVRVRSSVVNPQSAISQPGRCNKAPRCSKLGA
jgi:hypothetical protein